MEIGRPRQAEIAIDAFRRFGRGRDPVLTLIPKTP
jgi:hypothetical protein